MKYFILLLLLQVISLKANAQQYLLIQKGNDLGIVDYDSKENYKIYFGYYFKNEIKLIENDSLYNTLVGYTITNDTLNVYFENEGKISCKHFRNDIFKNSPFRKKFITNNLIAKNDINSKNPVMYKYNDISIFVYNCRKSKIIHKGNIILESNIRIESPQLSFDENNILFQITRKGCFFDIYSSIYEININSGTLKRITKKGYNPSYSPDGNYILYYKEPNNRFIRCYDKKTGKKDFYPFADKAFWLYK